MKRVEPHSTNWPHMIKNSESDRWRDVGRFCFRAFVISLGVMVTITEATRNAIGFAQESLGVERTQGLQLEEIESDTQNGRDAWRITLSMLDSSHPLAKLAALNPRREYKTFIVLKDTGEVIAMKIREMSGI